MSDIVNVEVLENKPIGAVVRILRDGRDGLIRRREFSWDKSVEARTEAPKVGEQLRAKILKEGRDYVLLSLRQLTNPWEDAQKRYRKKQVLRGEIVAVRRFAAFAQIEPGIDAIIWPQDVPMSPEQLLEDVLSVGDQVHGVVTEFDPKNEKLAISLTRLLKDLSVLKSEERREFQARVLRERSKTGRGKPKGGVRSGNKTESRRIRRRQPIPGIGKVLVIDDDENQLRKLLQHLRNNLDLKIEGVSSGSEAIRMFESGQEFDLVVIDLVLRDESGVDVARRLLGLKPDLAIILTSSNPLAEEGLPEFGRGKLPFSYKDPEDILEWIDRLRNGYWEEVGTAPGSTYTGFGSFAQQLGMMAFAQRSLEDVLRMMLGEVRRQTGVTQCMVLEVDSVNEMVSVLAADPPIDEEILEQSLDGLYYSPAREVVEYEQEFYATDVYQDRDSRFDYFFPLLSFRTCLGIPLSIPDLVTRHALFLLDERRHKLSSRALTWARLSSILLQVALERSLLIEYMRRYEMRYSRGQILGSLVHELTNKLDGFSGQIQTLPGVLEKLKDSEEADLAEHLGLAQEIASDLLEVRGDLDELVRAYSRLAKGDFELVDVNNIAHKVRRQMAKKAEETEGIEIHPDLGQDVPPVLAVETRLEQILMNLVLNSIQQIEEQRQYLARVAAQRDREAALLQDGQVIVRTRYMEEKKQYPVQVEVIDTGPGIHYYQQQNLFQIDVSTRQRGHGLGLFISRNLAEAMGGRIRLVDSVMFVGSRFVVEFPLVSADGGEL